MLKGVLRRTGWPHARERPNQEGASYLFAGTTMSAKARVPVTFWILTL